jgi:hypothetical protein
MDTKDEALIRLAGEQIITRAAIQWLLAREAERSGDIDKSLREASEKIGRAIETLPEGPRGTLQESLDQLIADALLEARA